MASCRIQGSMYHIISNMSLDIYLHKDWMKEIKRLTGLDNKVAG